MVRLRTRGDTLSSISQNFEKKRTTSIWRPLHERSVDILKDVEYQQTQFKLSFVKWLFLSRKEYVKIGNDYKYAVNDINKIIVLVEDIIQSGDQKDIEKLERFMLGIRLSLFPQSRPKSNPGLLTNIFEILPIITMTIVPSLIQAGLLALNVCTIACTIVIGVLLFLIKAKNVTQNIAQNIKKEDSWFLYKSYDKLIYHFKVPSEFSEKKSKSSNDIVGDKVKGLKRKKLFFYSAKGRRYFLSRNKKTSTHSDFILQQRLANNKLHILKDIYGMQVYA